MYSHLMRYFHKHLDVIRKDSEKFMDVSLLEYYTKQWVKFTNASTYVHHLFTYLNRHWVKREIDEGRKTVHDVGTVCFLLNFCHDDVQDMKHDLLSTCHFTN